jgi:hypothetical protein
VDITREWLCERCEDEIMAEHARREERERDAMDEWCDDWTDGGRRSDAGGL